MFLDEPTSGLDSVSAWKVVRILRAVANLGGKPSCTVVCSIHQPSSEVFREFSHVVFLGAGHVVYQGAVSDLDDVFAASGYPIPAHTNASDFVMLAIQLRPTDTLPRDDKNDKFKRRTVRGRMSAAAIGAVPDVVDVENASGVKTIGAEDDGSESDEVFSAGHANSLVQVWELSKREFRGLVRDTTALLSRFGSMAFLSILTAVLFYKNADSTQPGYTAQAAYGALVLLMMSTFMGNVQPVLLVIPLEKVMALREMGVGTYGIVPYALSKLASEIPVVFGAVLLALLITYWAVGFTANFGLLLLWLFLSAEAGISFAYILGSLTSTPQAAVELSPLVLVRSSSSLASSPPSQVCPTGFNGLNISLRSSTRSIWS